jgi:hypothetical protein
VDEQFLSTRSCLLSQKLIEWRKLKNLEPLKGSGWAAMISTWKALMKETRFVNSTQFPSIDGTRKVDSSQPDLSQERTTPISEASAFSEDRMVPLLPTTNATGSYQQDSREEMAVQSSSSCTSHSKASPQDQSDESLNCLSQYVRDFLRNRMQITTCTELLSHKSSDIVDEYVQWRREQNKPPLKGNGAYTTVCGWKCSVKEREKGIKRRRSDASTDSSLFNVSVSPVVSRKNMTLSSRDEFWENMNLSSVPTCLTGLPYVELTFRSTISAHIGKNFICVTALIIFTIIFLTWIPFHAMKIVFTILHCGPYQMAITQSIF